MRTANSSNNDTRRGEIYSLDGTGAIKAFLGFWDKDADLESGWTKVTVTAEPSLVQAMEGEIVLIAFEALNTESAPYEVNFFDDITLDVCYPDPAYIVVEKQTDPDGSSQLFKFQTSWLGNGSESYDFELSDGQRNQSAALAPGTYSVSELA